MIMYNLRGSGAERLAVDLGHIPEDIPRVFPQSPQHVLL